MLQICKNPIALKPFDLEAPPLDHSLFRVDPLGTRVGMEGELEACTQQLEFWDWNFVCCELKTLRVHA
ncbi:fad oxidoreductase [Corchorus olitorius]|uniref:Fad oxidoreductase n=1 Tax=Corchorus olitorius TaxID=93759 RepID=A0A1R3FWK2_9ROSI|nr:fad oxidoreductase [Corchorus olitorius]